ncbi:probable tubulin polyglutamylase TTLL1 isoform X1 [Drosophila novamexicana]|uniref:probable tubulin polyglutamylase TTLL1 isoform X1 n=2 Tax=Drosophila novamexicana TaxID=47314 RepID=UPI0011E6048C|nr:probable tubulin polyglutamylase TTLL1 isoform X1 [Drosophila novamexicana]XP_030567335.1 probable tubulin polyglutamylase TTLL1 isoform X1 [Drosophila novamexicana]
MKSRFKKVKSSSNNRDAEPRSSSKTKLPLPVFGLVSKERPWPRKERHCVYYSTDCDKTALINNFQKRGWHKVPAFDGEWNLYWACAQNCRYIFGVDHPYRMRSDQMINHFPNSMELSRKDLLVKNIKRYRKDLERKGDALAETHPNNTKLGIGGTRYMHLDIIPMTFVLPADYNLFVEEFHKNPASTWIVKPSDKSQGVGIYLINKLSKLKRFAYEARTFYPHFHRDTCVISKYIDNPLLIGGKKFDLRLYVLVTTFNPIKAYLYNEGFCRFCTQRYDQTEIDNVFMHLTNVSIQKNNVKEYNTIHGGKWSMQNLCLYLDSIRGEGVSKQLSRRISETIRHSLDAVAPVMANDRHCFEVYGYDIIIDNNLKPWLIEINTSPSIHSTTKNDCTLKTRLIDNVLDVVIPPSGMPDERWAKTPSQDSLKNFTLLTPVELPNPRKLCKLATPTAAAAAAEAAAAGPQRKNKRFVRRLVSGATPITGSNVTSRFKLASGTSVLKKQAQNKKSADTKVLIKKPKLIKRLSK